ncbi:HEAT repeat domain-containing protein [Halosimplex pelagicum]|uniref:HEAT repeat domain-containing protein n=1 Tax=Halosimplex pelagicum TaxID=869886 RepID=A0A7D5P7Q6_9EURY|nr:HEAT repeat domain-containing protein [Halosimplex pelagicum]QLH82957.1 HEAT repeat domain-containing protein [Halosimplex pelagicum]
MTEEYDNWSARGRAPAEDEAGLRAALDGDQPQQRDAALALVDAADSGCDDPDCDETGLEDATVDALAATVRSADDPNTRQFAVEALGVAGRAGETVAAALDDPDEWVRAEAVVALSRVAPGASERLRAALDDDHDAVRRNALIALARREAAGAETLVERLKSDPSPAVREYAAQYLPGAVETERAVRLLAAVLARDPGSFVRAKAAEGLGDLGTDRAEEALETHGLEDRSDDVRKTAERALARSKGVDPEELDATGDGSRESGPSGGRGDRGGRGHADQRPRPPGGADAAPGRIDDGSGTPEGPAPVGGATGPVGSHPGSDPRPPGHGDASSGEPEPTDGGDDDR